MLRSFNSWLSTRSGEELESVQLSYMVVRKLSDATRSSCANESNFVKLFCQGYIILKNVQFTKSTMTTKICRVSSTLSRWNGSIWWHCNLTEKQPRATHQGGTTVMRLFTRATESIGCESNEDHQGFYLSTHYLNQRIVVTAEEAIKKINVQYIANSLTSLFSNEHRILGSSYKVWYIHWDLWIH